MDEIDMLCAELGDDDVCFYRGALSVDSQPAFFSNPWSLHGAPHLLNLLVYLPSLFLPRRLTSTEEIQGHLRTQSQDAIDKMVVSSFPYL